LTFPQSKWIARLFFRLFLPATGQILLANPSAA
jgi:hypothetical protein